ncbi:MAG TPA: hypothetical protein VKT72_00450 [Candidatus Baltobacteraceae bacterium]|nr:hypothetical protein [Candidatus Baltobacteraceae bacterium]
MPFGQFGTKEHLVLIVCLYPVPTGTVFAAWTVSFVGFPGFGLNDAVKPTWLVVAVQ